MPDDYIEIKADVFRIMRAYSDSPAQSMLNAMKKYFKQDEMPMVRKALVELCDKMMEK